MELLKSDSYLVFVKNSVGSNAYRNLYASVNGEKTDILKDGKLSCAYFVSSILFLFKMLKGVHATVGGTVRDLRESGWAETDEPKTGDIVVWKAIDTGDGEGPHKHIGFYMVENKTISNDSGRKCPIEHDIDFREREIETIFHLN